MRQTYYADPEFCDRLYYEMNVKHISISEMARKVGVGRKSISAYVNGWSCPNSYILRKMCMVLNISADYLLGIEKGEEKCQDRAIGGMET